MASEPKKSIPHSLAFPPGRQTVMVREIAAKWRVSEQHVINLIESGRLAAVDVAGKFEFVRVPKDAIAALAKLAKTSPEKVLEVIQQTPQRPVKGKRSSYRVPVVEGYETFIQENSTGHKS